VLLGAGVAPASAWRHVAAGAAGAAEGGIGSGSDAMVELLAERIATGASVGAAIRDGTRDLPPDVASAWHGLGALWSVAADAGAPLARSLRTFADALRSLADVDRDLGVALAGPTATARTVLVLPAVGVVLGALLGFDTLRVLVATPFGLSCLAGGALLLVLARAWMRRLLRAARPRSTTPGLVPELMAVAMSGGASVDRARASVRRALALFSIDGAGADARREGVAGKDRPGKDRPGEDDAGEDGVVDAVLGLSRRAGVPAAELLRSEAELLRRRARADGRRAAEEAGAALMLPLGVCVLPAFLLVGVAPLLVSVLSSTLPAL
jgi:tight adherence protein B